MLCPIGGETVAFDYNSECLADMISMHLFSLLNGLFALLSCLYSSVPYFLQPPAKYLLPEVSINDYGKNCVVIDLDETLVHSSFKVLVHTHTHKHKYYNYVIMIFRVAVKTWYIDITDC